MTEEELKLYKAKLDSLTQKTSKCWYYIGPVEKNGRGYIKIGRKNKSTRSLAWELHNKEQVPEDFIIKMICEVPNCINPDHFESCRRTFPWRL